MAAQPRLMLRIRSRYLCQRRPRTGSQEAFSLHGALRVLRWHFCCCIAPGAEHYIATSSVLPSWQYGPLTWALTRSEVTIRVENWTDH